MEKDFSVEDAKELIRFARDNILYYLKHRKKMPIPEDLKNKYSKPLGAFVTLNKIINPNQLEELGSSGRVSQHLETDLRGCIGITMPVYPLIRTISEVSISAAVDDPRFPAVTIEEMEKIVIEISILTEPVKIKVKNPEEYLEKIKIGRDGLMIQKGFRKGLLLPQVPVEHGRNWDVKTFLEHLCMKAFLPKNAWMDKKTEIFAFQALVFEELTPRGEVIKKELA
ncbi:MAG: TIGR00296 family protein [Promethearchaeota archaeon]